MDPHFPFKPALQPWEMLEWWVLTCSDEAYAAWRESLPADVLVSDDMSDGDEVVASWEREVAASLANGGDGVPASWKTEEARWLDERIALKLQSLSTPRKRLLP